MATIDDELGARAIRTVVAREEERKLGDLLGGARSGIGWRAMSTSSRRCVASGAARTIGVAITPGVSN
jgi:hypothetical protein